MHICVKAVFTFMYVIGFTLLLYLNIKYGLMNYMVIIHPLNFSSLYQPLQFSHKDYKILGSR